MRFLIFLLLLGGTLYLLSYFGKRQGLNSNPADTPKGGGKLFKAKRNPGEIWVQVYETASSDEGRMIQARLQEEDLECILYEQGKKDIQGNALKGIGIAVPKTSTAQAQRVISRILA